MRLILRIADYRAAQRADQLMTDRRPDEAISVLCEDQHALNIYLRMHGMGE